MWYVRDVLYAVLYVRVSCFVVRGCGVSRRYIDVCYCDMFSVVNVYIDNLKFCIVCINSRRYVCCSKCNVVSNECNEPTSSFIVSSTLSNNLLHLSSYHLPLFLIVCPSLVPPSCRPPRLIPSSYRPPSLGPFSCRPPLSLPCYNVLPSLIIIKMCKQNIVSYGLR